jgi:hypothetical protein
MEWRKADLDARRGVVYLTPERAELHTEPGTLHRAGRWERSPALEAALRLEAGRNLR